MPSMGSSLGARDSSDRATPDERKLPTMSTHAVGLGAVGSTAFDDEVVEFFYPHAAGKDYMFVTVFGKRRPKRT